MTTARIVARLQAVLTILTADSGASDYMRAHDAANELRRLKDDVTRDPTERKDHDG